MKQRELLKALKLMKLLTSGILAFTLVLFVAIGIYVYDPSLSFLEYENQDKEIGSLSDDDLIENGIHIKTGLRAGEGLMLVVKNCTSCHSSKLITQNRASKEGWQSMIQWMQKTQNLWDLGENEERIVTYLATYYAPEEKGRRQNISNIEWYELE